MPVERFPSGGRLCWGRFGLLGEDRAPARRASVGRQMLPAACLGDGTALEVEGGGQGLLLSLWPRGAPST